MDVTISVPHSYIVANWFVVLGKKLKILKKVIDDVERKPNAEGDLSDFQIKFVFKSPDHNRDKNIAFQ